MKKKTKEIIKTILIIVLLVIAIFLILNFFVFNNEWIDNMFDETKIIVEKEELFF